MAQGLTLQQLQSMGAQPISPVNPVAPVTPNTTSTVRQPGQGITLQQLQAQGAVPITPQNINPVTNNQPTTDTYGASFQASANDNPLEAGLKSLGNVPSSLFNLGQGLVTAISHPIKTIEGIGNAFSGGLQEGWNAITHGTTTNIDTQTFDALKQSFIDRYGSLENAQKTATNDPMGFGADVLSILEGGASLADKALGTTAADLLRKTSAGLSGEVGKGFVSDINAGNAVHPSPAPVVPTQGMVRGALDNTLNTITKPVVNTLQGVVTAPVKTTGRLFGGTTGVGGDVIKQGFESASQGGEAMKSFTEALRGNTSPEDLVNSARTALGKVSEERGANYKKMLGSLQSDTSIVDTSPLKQKLESQLQAFDIKRNADGTLNFDESTLGKESDQKAISAMVKDIDGWQTNTPKGIDTLKQRLSNYWEPGSKVGAFSEGLRSTARGLIEQTPGYTDAMRNYSEMSDHIKDITKSLSLGDNASVETSFKKLTSALKNNDFRKEVIQTLDRDTGGQLMSKIAGQRLSSITPRGLTGIIEGGVGGIAALAHPGGLLPLLGAAVTTSPRLVGEFVRGLGLGAQGTTYLFKTLNRFGKSAVLTSNAVNRANIK